MSTDETIHTYSTPAEIKALLATWYDDPDQLPDTIEILLQPLSHPVWTDGYEIRDASGDEITASWLITIAEGLPIPVDAREVNDPGVLRVEQASGVAIDLHHEAIREIKIGGKRWHQIDGLDWAVVLQEDGGISVGCQRISREGVEAIVRLLAPHVGLRVVEADQTSRSSPVGKTHTWIVQASSLDPVQK